MERNEFIRNTLIAGLGISFLPTFGMSSVWSSELELFEFPKVKFHGRHSIYNPGLYGSKVEENHRVENFSKDVFLSETNDEIIRIEMNWQNEHRLSFAKMKNELHLCIDGEEISTVNRENQWDLKEFSGLQIQAVFIQRNRSEELFIDKQSMVFSFTDKVSVSDNSLGWSRGVLVNRSQQVNVSTLEDDYLLIFRWA